MKPRGTKMNQRKAKESKREQREQEVLKERKG
jgi:hypothetical protein